MNKFILIFYLLSIGLLSNVYSQKANFSIHSASDLSRIFEDGYRLPSLSDTIKVFGIRGEIISAQCAITSQSKLTNVTIDFSQIKEASSGKALPVAAVEYNFVGSVPLSENAPNQPADAVVRQAPALFPDYLKEERQINIAGNTYNAVWLTISIPRNAEAGSYSGRMIVKSGQGEKSMPLLVEVYPLLVSETRNMKVSEWYNSRNLTSFYEGGQIYSDEWFGMLKKVADNMAKHRQNVFQVPASSISISKNAEGDYQFDFTLFDKIANVFWETGKMDFLETGDMFRFKEDWFSTEIMFSNLVVRNEEGERTSVTGDQVLPFLLSALEGHLRQKKWLSKTLFHVKDEPSIHNAVSYNEASKYIHNCAPDLRRIDAIETSFVTNNLEIAIPKLDFFEASYADYMKAYKKGTELWYYTVGIYQASYLLNKTIDMPLIDSRLIPWLAYKYNATGYLHWGWNHWTEDPFNKMGMHIGDGWMVYPSKTGFLNSLRWEELRNGLQDYEYFKLLEDKISELKDSLGTRFSWINPSQRGKEIVGKVINSFFEHTYNPKVVYRAKKEFIDEIKSFEISPRVLVQTGTPEGTSLSEGTFVDVLGWVEPGTKVFLNGKPLPVSNEGLFLEHYQLSAKGSDIIVNVSKGKETKEIIRKFQIKSRTR